MAICEANRPTTCSAADRQSVPQTDISELRSAAPQDRHRVGEQLMAAHLLLGIDVADPQPFQVDPLHSGSFHEIMLGLYYEDTEAHKS